MRHSSVFFQQFSKTSLGCWSKSLKVSKELEVMEWSYLLEISYGNPLEKPCFFVRVTSFFGCIHHCKSLFMKSCSVENFQQILGVPKQYSNSISVSIFFIDMFYENENEIIKDYQGDCDVHAGQYLHSGLRWLSAATSSCTPSNYFFLSVLFSQLTNSRKVCPLSSQTV